MFDQSRTFGIQVPLLAQSSPTVLFALLALSARQMERSGTAIAASQDSLKLYSEAITSLTPALERKDESVLVAACTLCVLEMMSASPKDWRRHVEGCAALFEASGVHGLSGGLTQAIFWCYVRMDLCGAIIVDCAESTVLPIKKWAITADNDSSPDAIAKAFLMQSTENVDMHANYAVHLCARACDLISRRSRYIELGEPNGCDSETYKQSWTALWIELQAWLDLRPSQMLPLKTVESSATAYIFPRILYSHWAAVSGNQLYHTACLLLLDLQPDGGGSTDMNPDVGSTLYHARHIVGISSANLHKGCLNNAIQPLWVAGKFFTHREEHDVIIRLLDSIEAASGWAARWRIKDLEHAWGYPRGTFSPAAMQQIPVA